jgi:hypothetical protein
VSNEGNVARLEILPLLGPVRRQGEWIMAMCPSHADGTKHGGKAGQSLGLSNDGVLRCFAGCTFADVMAALRKGQDSRPRPMTRPQNSQGWPADPVAAYEYRDAAGELVAVKGRFERPSEGIKPEKTFRWRLPKGSYNDGLGGLPMKDMPLWGIGDVIANPTAAVWLAEGESATLAIRARNEVAVCGAWGASQRDFGQSFEVLRGRDVILWPDNDEPGRNYMEAVRRALQGVVRSVATVSAPVPPKGDAVEYFQAGGTIPELLERVLLKAAVDVIADDHFVVRIPTLSGPVAFDFANITKSGGSFDCELTVTHLSPGIEAEPYNQRINILSQSARSALETALGRQFGKEINWTTTVSTAYSRVRTAYLESDRAIQVGQLALSSDQRFTIETLIPEGQPSILFADGSSGKTMIAYGLGLAVALGGSFCDLWVRPGGVLIVDYEASLARFRLERLLAGTRSQFTLDRLPIHYWDGRGIPLKDQVEPLIRAIRKLDITLVIIDSGGAACGGEPEKAAVALEYFNALSRLQTTTLTICHVAKGGENDAHTLRPFGSAFWHNMARRTWYCAREQEDESDEMDLTLICRKVNDGRRPRPISFHVEFDGDSGPITIARGEQRAAAPERPVSETVSEYLKRTGAPATIAEIVRETGLANDSVRTVLYRGDKVIFRSISGGTGRGNQTKWEAIA